MQFWELNFETANIFQVQCKYHLISPDDISEICIDDNAYYPSYNSVKLA